MINSKIDSHFYIESENNYLFQVFSKKTTARNFYKGIISIPHAGECIPNEFIEFLNPNERIKLEDVDRFVHLLIDIPRLNEEGIVVIKSHIHRVSCDLNRGKEDAILHWETNTLGEPVRLKPLAEILKSEELNNLQNIFHQTYYDKILEIIKKISHGNDSKTKIKAIDLHSMPSVTTAYHLTKNPHQKVDRPDFCLSDLRGKSCPLESIKWLQEKFNKVNYQASINDPYFGGYGTENYFNMTKPSLNLKIDSMQIEIKRNLYMDEKNKELNFEKKEILKKKLTDIIIDFYLR
jgi:N-formylglutamate amidohydrolase